MSENLDDKGLKAIVEDYDIFYIDLWGVIHNGINLHKNAIKALEEITKVKKKYVLLTNAPRPNKTVKSFLEKMGMNKEIREKVYSSGEAALSYLKKNLLSEKFYHLISFFLSNSMQLLLMNKRFLYFLYSFPFFLKMTLQFYWVLVH